MRVLRIFGYLFLAAYTVLFLLAKLIQIAFCALRAKFKRKK